VIAIRGYTQKIDKGEEYQKTSSRPVPLTHDRVIVFDTETTSDCRQTLKIGYFKVYHAGYFQHHGRFYDPSMLDEKETQIIKSCAENDGIPLYEAAEFVDRVFYPEVFGRKALCIGFNLSFDISRLAIAAGQSRKANRGGFTLTLSEKEYNPPIIIKQMGAAHSFKFSTTVSNQRSWYFPGYFLDVQTLAEVLLKEEKLSLARVCEILNTPHKKLDGGEHGRVTAKYLEYNIQDVVCTYEAYTALIKELSRYGIALPPTRIFSSASLGKHVLTQLGIKPLFECQPDFPPELLGHIMTAYYGGRTECKIRKTPTRVTGLDFTSMYPSVTMLMGLWQYIIADSVRTEDATADARALLSRIDLSSLLDGDIWKDFVILVKVLPEEDIFPVRSDYKGDNAGLNVGINYLTSSVPLWYALPDVIASKLLTGKAPKIIEAIRFIPKGIQAGLNPSKIVDIAIDPVNDNLIQILVEERQKIRSLIKTMQDTDPGSKHLSSREHAMKILVNAMSYGIFIQLDKEETKSTIEVHALDQFTTDESYYEKPGNFFHPILGVVITAGSRLFLAMAEAKTIELGAHHAYMDTDSIFVPVELAPTIADFFQSLNPYQVDIDLLKQDKINQIFYGISSKRYVLYRYDGEQIEIKDYKLHGLGHLTNPLPNKKINWQEEIWRDLLLLHYNKISRMDIDQKYTNLYAVAKMTISTSHVYSRFKVINNGKEWRDQVKPFNFFNLGFQTREADGKRVKPLAPYSKDPQKIVHEPFINYETGTIMQGSKFFKPLSRTIIQYADHPEYKYDGNIGLLRRRLINVDGVLIIGKEANKIDDQPLYIADAQVFRNKNTECQKILAIRQCDAEKAGVDRKTFQRIKARIHKDGTINIKTGAVKRLLAMS
jgi:hypothetical protein